ADVRPGLPHRHAVRRSELLDDDRGPVPVQPRDREHQVRLRRRHRRRSLPLHLHGHADPAAAVRESRGQLMSTEQTPPVGQPWPLAVSAEELALEGAAAKGTPSTTSGIPGRERGDRIRTAIAYIVMFGVAILFAIPFLWSVSTSFRTLADTVAGFSLLPRHWTTSGYHEAFHTFNFGRYTLNSTIIAGAITLSNLVLASIGGYAFARLRFPGREALFLLVLGTLMIPDQLRLVPIYLMLVNWIPSWVGHLGWHNASFVNRNGVILIQLVSATSLFLMRQYFLTIPRDLEEAA